MEIRNKINTLFAATALCAAVALNATEKYHATHLVFTYMGDPSTTLTANWQLIGAMDEIVDGGARVYYDTVSREGDVDAYSNSATGIVFSIDGLTDRKVARVELGGLEPDTTYYVCVVIDGMPVLPEVKVHTIP
ncbi:MAG TPA: hypothetical protein DCX06_12220, partial [Opitutae bacterium]|nr:hypothetical protein [Opitutae bacterium]